MTGPMTGLALRSLAHRRTANASTFLSVALATALIGSFATLLEAGLGAAAADQETLMIMGIVVGSWGAVIALFSLASTVAITVGHRDLEVGLLRTIGATPAQVRRMVRAETLGVAVIGAGAGALLAWLGGRLLLGMLQNGDLVSDTLAFRGGPASLGLTAGALVVVSLLAATMAGRRATRAPARLVLTDARAEARPMRRWRVVTGLVLIAYGGSAGVLTMTVMTDSDDPYAPMQTAGSAAIVVGVGLACLAPILLRWSAVLLRPVLGRTGAGHVAAFNASRRAPMLAGALGPVIVFVAATVGVFMMVGIDGRTLAAIVPDQQEADTITLLNYVVTGMIAVFALIMVANSVVAVTSRRGPEFDRLRLAGATAAQVRRSVLVETGVLAAAGVGFGLLASLVTVVPYAVARDEGAVPDGQLWVPAVMAAVAVAVLTAAASVTTRRTLTGGRGRAVAA